MPAGGPGGPEGSSFRGSAPGPPGGSNGAPYDRDGRDRERGMPSNGSEPSTKRMRMNDGGGPGGPPQGYGHGPGSPPGVAGMMDRDRVKKDERDRHGECEFGRGREGREKKER